MAESGLTDCAIPFDRLRTQARSCRGADRRSDRRCETYSPSQFPEVVAFTRTDAEAVCSGTVVTPTLVVTAAHCLVGEQSSRSITSTSEADYLVPDTAAIRVDAPWALTVPAEDRSRRVRRALVYSKYTGAPEFRGDLAVLELDHPFPDTAVQPAVLVPESGAVRASTLGGYGATNADGGGSGRLNISWPVPLTLGAETLTFRPSEGSAFCKGDSGGPVFAGRYRGCRPYDAGGEPRPRILQGVISAFNFDGRMTPAVSAMEWASNCMAADLMISTSLAAPEHREWICAVTGGRAGGC